MKIKPNSGLALQKLAKIIMLIGFIASLLCGIFACETIADGSGIVGCLVLLVVFGVGCLISWLSTRFLHGFGELIQYTAEAATYLEALATAAKQDTTTVAENPPQAVMRGKRGSYSEEYAKAHNIPFVPED